MTRLTISIPAYNDAESIRQVVEHSLAAAARCTDDYEVLVINDGSTDQTQAVIDQICRDLPRVRAIQHARNLGFGPTIREAYLNPASDWIVFLPGDGQIPPAEVVVLWEARTDCELVLARRRKRRDPINRRFASGCYNRLVSLVAGTRIHDVNATALVQRRRLQQISLESDTAFVHAEIVLKAIRSGVRMKEVEIDHRPREFGSGSGNKPSVIWGTFKDLTRYAITRPAPSRSAGEASYEV